MQPVGLFWTTAIVYMDNVSYNREVSKDHCTGINHDSRSCIVGGEPWTLPVIERSRIEDKALHNKDICKTTQTEALSDAINFDKHHTPLSLQL